MKKYTKPSFEVIKLENADIIQTSGILTDGGNVGDFTGGGAGAGWGSTTNTLNQQKANTLYDNN